MQDPTTFPPFPFPEQEQLKCPRCDSTNTKFCYYNNYNLSQPRHFCKNCRRYWTKGGTLRNIPVGGGSRKNTRKASTKKGSSSASSSPSSSSSLPSVAAPAIQTTVPDLEPARTQTNPVDQVKPLLDSSGSISSLLGTGGQFGSFLEDLHSNVGVKVLSISERADNVSSDPLVNSGAGRGSLQMQSNNNSNSESFLGMQTGDSSCWNNGNEWSNLAIYSSGVSLSAEAEKEKANHFA